MSKPPAAPSEGEMLYGAARIAAFLGITVRQTYHLVETGTLPTFKVGAVVCARPERLRVWLSKQEHAAAALQCDQVTASPVSA